MHIRFSLRTVWRPVFPVLLAAFLGAFSHPAMATEAEADTPLPEARYESRNGVLVRTDALPDREGSALLMFTGDIMCLAGQQSAARSGSSFSDSFRFVRSLFALSDLAVGNLETAISPSAPLTLDRRTGSDGKPYCNAPEALADALRYAGFDALVTANNHCCDAGEAGIRETIAALDTHTLFHTGTFADASEPRFLLFDANGIRIGMIATTNSVNGHERSISADARPWMVNLYEEERIRRDIASAREAGAEFVIAWMHSGKENSSFVTRIQRDHAAFLADAGADLVLGAHPHVLQKAEYLTSTDGRKVLCAYSLGNFLSSMSKVTGNRDTVILCVMLRKTENGIELTDVGYIGARVLNTAASGPFTIVPVAAGLNGVFSDKSLSAAGRRIRKAIGSELTEITDPEDLHP